MSLLEISETSSYKYRLRTGFFILGFVILQATGLDYLRVNNIKPNLILILVVFFSFYLKPSWAFFLAIVIGLLKDSLSLVPWGSSILGFGLCSGAIIALRRYIYRDNYLTQIILTCFACAFFSLFSLSYATFIQVRSAGGIFLVPLEFLYTALISPIVLFLLRKAFNE